MLRHSPTTLQLLKTSPLLLSTFYERTDAMLGNMPDPTNNSYAVARLMNQDRNVEGDPRGLLLRTRGTQSDGKIIKSKHRSDHVLWGGKRLDRKSRIFVDPPRILEQKKRRYLSNMATESLPPPTGTGYYELHRHQQQMKGGAAAATAEGSKSDKK